MPAKALAALLVVLAVMSARAGTLDLAYGAVMHVRESQSQPVLDDPAHLVGVASFRGIAIFGADEAVPHRYEGWFDLVQGTGPFHGYALWTFGDGAVLRAAYEGRAESDGTGGVAVSATFHSFTGTGRFAGVAGSGDFAGRRLEAIDVGGSTYLKGRLNLTLPD
jgi:hypothetical protein